MTDQLKSGFAQLAREQSLYPQEAPAKIKKSSKSLFIGVPMERSLQESRVALKPESVEVLTSNGHEVWIEAGAGISAHFSDAQYSEAGAKIVEDTKEVFKAHTVLKVEPPTMEEIEYLNNGATIISAFQSGRQSVDYIHALNKKKITAIGYEFIEDKVGGLPLVRAMSEIAGSTVMLIAAELLSNTNNGQGVILGGITGVPPTQVVILGAGTVGEYAARASIGLGVDIQVFDNHIYKLRRIKHALGQQIHTSTIDTATLTRALANADVVIGAIRAEKGRNKCVVTEEMVSNMKPGSVIIDVSIDQGGCIETSDMTSHKKPTFKKHGVVHYCVPNIASRVARTASIAISNIFTPMLLNAADAGGIDEMIFNHTWFMRGVYTYRGSICNIHLARKFNLGYKDLNLLMAARF
ncbi:MAG: alanine dehydrogenase [Flammeovirgaceae bacterium]|nr:alanine dehydrogenase [Flammeovirgaceae bacterium]MBR10646.1 alanine dehydrogenase [Rickettsiales bacterium]HCX22623.1 alanine dehydrogenase [Cytophagales bacterium]